MDKITRYGQGNVDKDISDMLVRLLTQSPVGIFPTPEVNILETNRIVVDSGGNGDYTTIQAAINYIAGVAAGDAWLIDVRSGLTGNYDESLDIGFTLPLNVSQLNINGLGLVQIRPSANNAICAANYVTGGGARVIFSNIVFYYTSGTISSYHQLVQQANGGYSVYYNCAFYPSQMAFQSAGIYECHDCYFEHLNSVNANYVGLIGFDAVNNATYKLYNCNAIGWLTSNGSSAVVIAADGTAVEIHGGRYTNKGTAYVLNCVPAESGTLSVLRVGYDTTKTNGTITVLDGDVPTTIPAGSIPLARGSLLVGNSSGIAAAVGIGGVGAFVTNDGTDTKWSTGFLSITTGKTLTVSDSATIANAALTLANTKVLTLTNSLTNQGGNDGIISWGAAATLSIGGSIGLPVAGAIGDLLYGTSTTAFGRLADVAAGQPLLSGGVTTAPAYAGYTFSGTAAQTYTFPSTSGTLAKTTDLPVGANPTASVGLTAINGSAATFLRSDGAPALDQSIAPTMTGAWIYQIGTDSTTALQIKNHAGTSIVFDADTSNKRIGIGTAAPLTTLHVVNEATTTTIATIRIQGGSVTGGGGRVELIEDNYSAGIYQRGGYVQYSTSAMAGSTRALEMGVRIDTNTDTPLIALSTSATSVAIGRDASIGTFISSVAIGRAATLAHSTSVIIAAGNGTTTSTPAANTVSLGISGTRLLAASSTGVGLGIDAAAAQLHVVKIDAVTNAITNATIIGHNSSGTAAANFGSSLTGQIQDSTTADQTALEMQWLWATATHASRKARGIFNIWDTAAREALRIEASGSAAMIGFLGAAAAVQQAATVDLGTVLSNFGLRAAGPASLLAVMVEDQIVGLNNDMVFI